MTETPRSGDHARPAVTVGMPVCNGERFLRQALDCWMAQDFTNYRLIISDDASTDSTPQICRVYAARDHRIRYLRSDRNQGAVWNFNYLYSLADTEFFAWAAQDDYWEPTFLRKCVELLRGNPDAAGAHTRIRRITADGTTYAGPFGGYVAIQDDAAERFRTVLSDWLWCFAHYGVWRTETIRPTRLYRKVYGPDHVFVAEAVLYGKVFEVPEVLWAHRTCNPLETNKEYVERVRRGLEPHSKPGSYRYPFAAITWEQLRTALTAPFPFSTRCRLVWSVLSRFWIHQAVIAVVRRKALRMFGEARVERVIRWLRRQGWYRRWRGVPEGL